MPQSRAASPPAFGQSRPASKSGERADPWLMDDASMGALGLSPSGDADPADVEAAAEKCRHPVAAHRRAFAGAAARGDARAEVSTNVVGEIVDAATYGAAFTAGLFEGSWSAVVDLFQGAADMIELVGKVVRQLFTDAGALKAMLMAWVDKLKLAWANRSAIADDFMQKWESDDDWTRGNFQGEVLGWVMMTALLILATSGASALTAATGRWASTLHFLATIDALGDLTTYLAKLGRLPAKVVAALRTRFGKGATDAASDTAADAAKASDSAADAASTSAKPSDSNTDLPKDGSASSSSSNALPDEWVNQLKLVLNPDELAQYERMKGKWKSPEEMHQSFGGDFDAARQDIAREVSKKAEASALKERSLRRVDQIRAFVKERGLLKQEKVRALFDELPDNPSKMKISETAFKLRNIIISDLRADEVASRFPDARVLREVKIWEEKPEITLEEFMRMSREEKNGLTLRTGKDGLQHLYKDVTDIDLLLVGKSPEGGPSKFLRFEQQKTGATDTPSAAKDQNDTTINKLKAAREGAITIRLELEDKVNIIDGFDLSSVDDAVRSTVGPAGKGFDESIDIIAADLERLMKILVSESIDGDVK